MLTNLNEKYLLKFISNADIISHSSGSELLDLLSNLGVKIKFNNTNPVYDLIDMFEYAGMYYE